MKKRLSKCLAGVLVMAFVFSHASSITNAEGLRSQAPGAGQGNVTEEENKPGEGTETKPGEGTENKPGEGTENKPGEGSETKPGEGTENKPGEGAENKPGEGTENKPGEGAENKPGEGTENKPKAPADAEGSAPGTTAGSETGAKGLLEVRLVAGVEQKAPQQLQVTLKGASKTLEETVTLPAAEADQQSAPQVQAVFSKLEKGSYELQISGEGYETYQQAQIQIENKGYRMQVYVGSLPEGIGDLQPGLMVSKIDQDSIAEEIVDAIQRKSYVEKYDLNGDQNLDLKDLDYFTKYIRQNSRKSQSAVLEAFTVVAPDQVTPKVGDGTKLDKGTLDGLRQGTGAVALKPAAGSISESSPVEISFDFSNGNEMERIMLESPAENAIAEGAAEITYVQDGVEQTGMVAFSSEGALPRAASRSLPQEEAFSVLCDEKGTLQIQLGGQIAVKRVTFRITKTSNKDLNLAEISSVDFVNGMENRIPDPALDIPTEVKAEPGSKTILLSWKKQTNVTAYEVEISDGTQTELKKTIACTGVAVKTLKGEKLENKKEYTIRVRSINGTWKSSFSEPVTAIPKAEKPPERPERVTVTGGFRSILVKWGNVKDADTFNVYYRESGTEAYTKVEGIEANSYQVEGLKDDTKYEVYVTGVNEIGEGAASLTGADKTMGKLEAVKLPEYKLINTSNGEGVLSSHIKSASTNGGGTMMESPLDKTADSALGLFDNDCYSYVYREDWDYGGAYPGIGKGITVELDKAYELGMITFAEPVDLGSYIFASVKYWDEGGKEHSVSDLSISQKKVNGRNYYLIKFNEAVKASKLQLGMGRYNGGLRKVTVSEIRLYEYDSLEQDILSLYSDDLHITLQKDVTEQTIQELQKRLDTKDPVSGEYHPEKEILQKELDAAKQLLETGSLGGVLTVNPDITRKKDSGISVGGLNGWQPLGITAAAGEELVIYVGGEGKKTGDVTPLDLVFTQYYAESGGFFQSQPLKIGRNEIRVPKISSNDMERGGPLYVQYNGNNSNDNYAVRVSGGVQYPVLSLYQVSDSTERTEKINAYVQELKAYVSTLKAQHEELHKGSGNDNTAYDYKEAHCVLNTTDIQLDQMMLSIPASQVLAGLGSSGAETKLANTTKAMEDMLLLFYQHKGLTNSFAEGTSEEVVNKNHLPYQYLNIRYMKMFSGAFMYASGNHVGIEWPETKGLMNGVPVQADEKGAYKSGSYFGWGIAHEIGHEINQGAYAYAEVTNNYFSVLAQAKDTNDSVRFQYPEVFKKVTSGTTGYADNVFTQLGLYWQLHLAYDRDYNYKTYSNYQEIIKNRFFARVDSYARNTGAAPAPKGVSLTLSDERDQNLMRLSSAAAERDLTEFFVRWGMRPDEATLNYMKQFDPEERAIYYVDDAARVYEMTNNGSDALTGKEVVTAEAAANDSKVTLKLTYSGKKEVLQGYEIARIWTEQGQERREVCGFTQEGSYQDQLAFAPNRAVAYEVTAIDKYMNRSAVYRTDVVKTSGDGIQDKAAWTIETNMVSAADKTENATDANPCEPVPVPAAQQMIDGSDSTTFAGTAANGDPYIILKLNRSTEVTALRYRHTGQGQSITDYRIEVSRNGESYTKVKEGTFGLKDGSQTVYFENGEDPWVCTYDASYVKLTAVGQKGKELSITELDLYGPSGDNVEFLSAANGQAGIGLLEEDYSYDTKTNAKIPKGSIVFTGTYKGNPAYNVVVLYDEQGRIVGGENEAGELIAQQVILAPDPGDAQLGEVSEGTWIYWIEPGSGVSKADLPAKVRAELYRVDNAMTNEGQRLVSDTTWKEVPGTLPPIRLKK